MKQEKSRWSWWSNEEIQFIIWSSRVLVACQLIFLHTSLWKRKKIAWHSFLFFSVFIVSPSLSISSLMGIKHVDHLLFEQSISSQYSRQWQKKLTGTKSKKKIDRNAMKKISSKFSMRIKTKEKINVNFNHIDNQLRSTACINKRRWQNSFSIYRLDSRDRQPFTVICN